MKRNAWLIIVGSPTGKLKSQEKKSKLPLFVKRRTLSMWTPSEHSGTVLIVLLFDF